MHVKELPRRVEGQPVVKVLFLGWLGAHGGPLSVIPGAGYYAVALTHDHSAAPDQSFHVHLMHATGLDKPWKVAETHRNLNNGTGNATFDEYVKLADWPEGVHS